MRPFLETILSPTELDMEMALGKHSLGETLGRRVTELLLGSERHTLKRGHFLNSSFFSQYVVVTVCLKAGLETTAWTKVSFLWNYFPLP
jgi:hypothetical protein